MKNNKPVDPCKAITGKDTRLCYPHVWEPFAMDGDKLKYSCCAGIPKTDTETVEKIRKAAPDVGLTTDIIVAFPGETDRDFEDTMDLVRQVGYDSAFTFIYSPRVGTRAAEMPGRIDPALATERIERLIILQEEMTQMRFAEMIGRTESVLVTGQSKRDDTQFTGKTSRNISVNFEGSADMIGQIVPVKITAASKTTLKGKI